MSQHSTDFNVEQTLKQLSYAFYSATRDFPEKAVRGNSLYTLQVSFAYMLDDIKRGPKYIAPKLVAECVDFINRTVPEKAKSVKAAQKA